MEKYESGGLPREATRVSNSPKMTFRTNAGHSGQTWHVTRINIVFIRISVDLYVREGRVFRIMLINLVKAAVRWLDPHGSRGSCHRGGAPYTC